MRLAIPLFFAAAMLAPAQIVSFGVKAGAPLTTQLPYFFDYGTNMVDTGRWTLGPTVEFRLGRAFSIEVDALYRGYRSVLSFASPQVIGGGDTIPPRFFSNRQDTKIWDVPLLLKYRFTAGRVHPFADVGYTWSHESFDEVATSTCLGTSDACNALSLKPCFIPQVNFSNSRNRNGATAGVGVEFKYGKVKIAPELRYTRFGDPNRNNATLMAGFTF